MLYFIIFIMTLSLSLLLISKNNIEQNYIFEEDFISLNNYPELNILNDNYKIILEELNYILENGLWANYDDLHGKDIFRKGNMEYVLSEMKNSETKVEKNTKNPKWKMFGLLFNKQSINENLCPKTIELLKSIPCVINAGFSCLEPNKRTDVHSDDNDIYYRYQLPLIVPKGNTGFKVNNTSINYELGKPFIFDDCMSHQAWNDTNEIRVVLICDIDRKI